MARPLLLQYAHQILHDLLAFTSARSVVKENLKRIAQPPTEALVGAPDDLPYNRASAEGPKAGTYRMQYAEVALNVPVHKAFTYHIPANLEAAIAPGSLVSVEFGVAMQPAVVLALVAETAIPQTKPILDLLDPDPVLEAAQLDLARWFSENCLAPIGACIWLLLPPGFTGKSDRQYRFLEGSLEADQPQQMTLPGADPNTAMTLPQRLLDALRERGPRRLTQLKRVFPKEPIAEALDRLVRSGLVAVESVLAPPSARIKTVTRVYPRYTPAEIPGLVKQFGKSPKRADLLEVIAKHDDDALGVREALGLVGIKSRNPLTKLVNEGLVFIEKTERGEQDLIILEAAPDRVEALLEQWRGVAYMTELLREIVALPAPLALPELLRATGASRGRINRLARAGILELRKERVWRDSLRDYDFVPDSAPKLTRDQEMAWREIRPALQGRAAARFLLHGVTGSGKTEIYLRAIEATLAQGRGAILLVPEIALTPQTVRRVSERFPGQVALVHGSLPMGERYDAWQRARSGAVSVIVGTRSALFTPLPKLGLIVLDEEHDAQFQTVARDSGTALSRARRGRLSGGTA